MNETKTRQRSGKALMIAEIAVIVVLALLVAAYFTLLSAGQNEYTIYDGDQVLRSAAQQAKLLEPHLGMFLLIIRGLLENGCDLLKTFLFCAAGKIRILVSGLALTGKRGEQIGLGL